MEGTVPMEYHLHPMGENAIIIELGQEMNTLTHEKVQVLSAYFEDHPLDWVVEYVPAFTTVTVYYDPFKLTSAIRQSTELPSTYVCRQLESLLSKLTLGVEKEPRIVDIPVCYGGELGPDLETVARLNDLTTEEVIHIHSTGDYIVYMIGFAPGFPYIGGMSEKIAAPRLASPRLRIPERSVGIAGKQTGIYPIETPGGWQLIGRTPIHLFRPNDESPSLLKAGDNIRFTPISYKEYLEWEDAAK